MDWQDYIDALITNYLTQVTAYAKKRYSPAAEAQYNEMVTHINALVAVGVIDGGVVEPTDVWTLIGNSEQLKYANNALFGVFNDEESNWTGSWPIPLV